MEKRSLTAIEEFEDDDFVALARLHFDAGVSIGALATAIENDGVCGWDRFGRYKRFDKDSQEAGVPLDRLALQYARNENPMDSGGPDDSIDAPLNLWGWPKKELPDFGAVEAGQPRPKVRPADVARVAKSQDMLIGALTECVLAKGPWEGHPQLENQAALIEAMAGFYLGLSGMSKRSLETALARGRAAVKTY